MVKLRGKVKKVISVALVICVQIVLMYDCTDFTVYSVDSSLCFLPLLLLLVMIIGSKLLPIIMSKSGEGASRFILPIFKTNGGGGHVPPPPPPHPVPYTPGAHAGK